MEPMNTVARDRLIQSVCTQVPANVSAPMTKYTTRISARTPDFVMIPESLSLIHIS